MSYQCWIVLVANDNAGDTFRTPVGVKRVGCGKCQARGGKESKILRAIRLGQKARLELWQSRSYLAPRYLAVDLVLFALQPSC